MDRTDLKFPKRYFTQLKQNLFNQLGIKTQSDINQCCFPLQFRYIHNLLDAKLETVEGVERVLGYSNKDFTLPFYYQKLHPDDAGFVFEATRKGFKFLMEEERLRPFQSTLLICYRMKKKNGVYAHILRQTSVWEVVDGTITKTISVCVDISDLNLRPYVSLKYRSSNNLTFDERGLMPDNCKGKPNAVSKRELAVLRLISEGKSSCEVAAELGISTTTVNTHRRNILKKTGSKNIIEAITKMQVTQQI